MKAMVLRRYGAPDVLEPAELPDPVPGPGEVLVRLEASAVNPIDLGVRRGDVLPDDPDRFPMVLGWDGVGTVVGRGPDTNAPPDGTRVLCMSAQPATGVGTHAELAAVSAERVVPLPDGLDTEIAVCLPLVGVTTLDALDALALSAGETLAINGHPRAAIGAWARALAAARGVRVVEVDEGTRTVDAALDVRGRDEARAAFDRVVDGGRYATVVPESWKPGGPFAEERGIRPVVVENAASRDKLERLAALGADGTLVPEIGRRWPLEALADAHAALERPGPHGRQVLVH